VEVSELELELEVELGPGSFSPAGSDERLAPNAMLEPGNTYDFNLISRAGGWAADCYPRQLWGNKCVASIALVAAAAWYALLDTMHGRLCSNTAAAGGAHMVLLSSMVESADSASPSSSGCGVAAKLCSMHERLLAQPS
jgi:hypothetical protein